MYHWYFNRFSIRNRRTGFHFFSLLILWTTLCLASQAASIKSSTNQVSESHFSSLSRKRNLQNISPQDANNSQDNAKTAVQNPNLAPGEESLELESKVQTANGGDTPPATNGEDSPLADNESTQIVNNESSPPGNNDVTPANNGSAQVIDHARDNPEVSANQKKAQLGQEAENTVEKNNGIEQQQGQPEQQQQGQPEQQQLGQPEQQQHQQQQQQGQPEQEKAEEERQPEGNGIQEGQTGGNINLQQQESNAENNVEKEKENEEHAVEKQQEIQQKENNAVSDEIGVNNLKSNDKEGDDSFFGIVVFLMAFSLVGGLAWFRRNKGNEVSSDIKVSGNKKDFGLSVSFAESQHFNKSETVPLAATTDDEEWGWEDNSDMKSAGEMELIGRKKEDADLTKAFSMQSSSFNSASMSNKVKNSPVFSRRTTPLSNFRSSSSIPKPSVQSSNVMPTMKITNLGKSSSTSSSIIRKKKKKDDDLFASMGLAAKPTFSSNKTKVKPVSTTASALAPKISALAAPDFNSASNDWDDDGDLDDLLND